MTRRKCTYGQYDIEYNYDACCFELPAWSEVCSLQLRNETVNVLAPNEEVVNSGYLACLCRL